MQAARSNAPVAWVLAECRISDPSRPVSGSALSRGRGSGSAGGVVRYYQREGILQCLQGCPRGRHGEDVQPDLTPYYPGRRGIGPVTPRIMLMNPGCRIIKCEREEEAEDSIEIGPRKEEDVG